MNDENKYYLLRGGSWYSTQGFARLGYRDDDDPGSRAGPDNRDDDLGFRVVCACSAAQRKNEMPKEIEVAIRGGSWINHQDDMRAAPRYTDHPSARDDYFGFRVVREKKEQEQITFYRIARRTDPFHPPSSFPTSRRIFK